MSKRTRMSKKKKSSITQLQLPIRKSSISSSEFAPWSGPWEIEVGTHIDISQPDFEMCIGYFVETSPIYTGLIELFNEAARNGNRMIRVITRSYMQEKILNHCSKSGETSFYSKLCDKILDFAGFKFDNNIPTALICYFIKYEILDIKKKYKQYTILKEAKNNVKEERYYQIMKEQDDENLEKKRWTRMKSKIGMRIPKSTSKKISSTNILEVRRRNESELNKRDEDRRDIKYMDNPFEREPKINIIINTFYEPQLLFDLIKIHKFPINCIISVGSSKNTADNKQDISNEVCTLTKEALEKRYNKRKPFIYEEQFELTKKEINNFWQGLYNHLLQSENSNHFGKIIIANYSPSISTINFQKDWRNEIKITLYNEISLIMLDQFYIKQLFELYMSSMPIENLESKKKIELSKMSLYNEILDNIPNESMTTPIIFDTIISQVAEQFEGQEDTLSSKSKDFQTENSTEENEISTPEKQERQSKEWYQKEEEKLKYAINELNIFYDLVKVESAEKKNLFQLIKPISILEGDLVKKKSYHIGRKNTKYITERTFCLLRQVFKQNFKEIDKKYDKNERKKYRKYFKKFSQVLGLRHKKILARILIVLRIIDKYPFSKNEMEKLMSIPVQDIKVNGFKTPLNEKIFTIPNGFEVLRKFASHKNKTISQEKEKNQRSRKRENKTNFEKEDNNGSIENKKEINTSDSEKKRNNLLSKDSEYSHHLKHASKESEGFRKKKKPFIEEMIDEVCKNKEESKDHFLMNNLKCIEELNPEVLLQTLLELSITYNSQESFYIPILDAFLFKFSNNCKNDSYVNVIPTPISKRDFLNYTFHEENKWVKLAYEQMKKRNEKKNKCYIKGKNFRENSEDYPEDWYIKQITKDFQNLCIEKTPEQSDKTINEEINKSSSSRNIQRSRRYSASLQTKNGTSETDISTEDDEEKLKNVKKVSYLYDTGSPKRLEFTLRNIEIMFHQGTKIRINFEQTLHSESMINIEILQCKHRLHYFSPICTTKDQTKLILIHRSGIIFNFTEYLTRNLIRTANINSQKNNSSRSSVNTIDLIEDEFFTSNQNETFERSSKFKLTITWPSGLYIETIIGKENSVFIKQIYLSKGTGCKLINNELFRINLKHGLLLKYMNDNTIIILYPCGRKIICKEFTWIHNKKDEDQSAQEKFEEKNNKNQTDTENKNKNHKKVNRKSQNEKEKVKAANKNQEEGNKKDQENKNKTNEKENKNHEKVNKKVKDNKKQEEKKKNQDEGNKNFEKQNKNHEKVNENDQLENKANKIEKDTDKKETENEDLTINLQNIILINDYKIYESNGVIFEVINGTKKFLGINYIEDFKVFPGNFKMCEIGRETILIYEDDSTQIVEFDDGTRITTKLMEAEEEIFCEWNENEMKKWFANELDEEYENEFESLYSESTSFEFEHNENEEIITYIKSNRIKRRLVDEGYIFIYLSYRTEHINYASTFEYQNTEIFIIDIPMNIKVQLMKNGDYYLQFSKTTSLSILDDRFILNKFVKGSISQHSVIMYQVLKYDEPPIEPLVHVFSTDVYGNSVSLDSQSYINYKYAMSKPSPLCTKYLVDDDRFFLLKRNMSGMELFQESRLKLYKNIISRLKGGCIQEFWNVPFKDTVIYYRAIHPSQQWLMQYIHVGHSGDSFTPSTYGDSWIFPFKYKDKINILNTPKVLIIRLVKIIICNDIYNVYYETIQNYEKMLEGKEFPVCKCNKVKPWETMIRENNEKLAQILYRKGSVIIKTPGKTFLEYVRKYITKHAINLALFQKKQNAMNQNYKKTTENIVIPNYFNSKQGFSYLIGRELREKINNQIEIKEYVRILEIYLKLPLDQVTITDIKKTAFTYNKLYPGEFDGKEQHSSIIKIIEAGIKLGEFSNMHEILKYHKSLKKQSEKELIFPEEPLTF